MMSEGGAWRMKWGVTAAITAPLFPLRKCKALSKAVLSLLEKFNLS
jgi:hypothetical protein